MSGRVILDAESDLGVAEIELVIEAGRLLADDLVADKKPGIDRTPVAVDQIEEGGACAEFLSEEDAGKGDRGVAVGIAGEGADILDGLVGENTDGQGGPVAADGAAGDEAEAGLALVVDDREQGDVEAAIAQARQKPRGNLEA